MRTPKAPDPAATAAAQAGMNRDTAITQGQMNMIDQSGPWGSVTYDQTGENSFVDSQGNVVTTPKYTQNTNLSPSQQAIFDQTQAAERNLAGIAANQSDFLQGYLGEGIDLSGLPDLQSSFGPGFNSNFDGDLGLATSYAGADDFSADRQRYEDALWDRTAGDRASQEEALRTRLANSGIREGSAAWNAEMERMQRQNTDARMATIMAGGQEQQRMVDMARQAAGFGNESLLAQGAFGMGAQQAQNAAAAQQAGFRNQARQQGIAEQFAQRNQPLNEITALLSGSQVSNPAQMGAATPQVGVGGVDYTGLVNQNYQNQMNAHQNQMGGLFGLGGSIFGAAGNAGGFGSLFTMSDERLKTQVERVGTTNGGLPIYTYRYIWGGPVQMGVMAQDAEMIHPDAVHTHESGFKMVDYARVH